MNDSLNGISDGLAALDVSNLPIAQYRSKIVDTVKRNQVTVVFGDTGSGKTTQIPQYLYQAGLHDDLVIAITQPRRIAAISMAKRVAEEMRCGLGIEVGYEVRFESRYSGSTKIKYMTDGTLLNYCLSDPRLSEYGIVMIDEAHERSIHTDVLLGLVKRIITKRKDLKILITSATITTEKFSEYFNGAPVISFEGRCFPVEVEYKNCSMFIEESIDLVKRIHGGHEKGDILVFLTGQDDIDICCEGLADIDNLVVLPLHGSMDCDSQQRVFKDVGKYQRKVVVATNVAETTITIDGIKFVIDCGYVKQNIFNINLGMEVLEHQRISKAQADQRKGRAGRTAPGKCFRLYDEFTYDFLKHEARPEIMRKNLNEIYLKIVAMGLDPMNFNFIDPPDPDSVTRAGEELQELDLLDESMGLTTMGRSMADLPVDPIIGKVLISSAEYHCTKDIVTILSLMTEKNILKRINDRARQDQVRRPFFHPYGDHLTLLNVFNRFMRNEKSKEWCYQHYLNYDRLVRVDQAREQLLKIMHDKRIPLESLSASSNGDPIRSAIIKGYYRNVCYKGLRGKYIRFLDNQELYIHPGSCLFKESPQLILYHDIMRTKKSYMHGIMKLEEAELANFPKEMRKIRYKTGAAAQRMNFMDRLNSLT